MWDTLAIVKPALTAATRVIWTSPEFAFAPLVAHSGVTASEFRTMQQALLGMTADAEGARLLRGLNLDGFIAGDLRLYADTRRLIRAVGDR